MASHSRSPSISMSIRDEARDTIRMFRMLDPIAKRTKAWIEERFSQETFQTPIILDSESDDSPHQAPIPDKCSNKPITMSRTIDFTFLENEGFNFGNKLIKMSWKFLCLLNVPTYPSLVKEFYNTLVEVEDRCQSMVEGK